MLEGVVHRFAGDVVGDVKLDAAAHVLNGRETRFAHYAFQHHAAGDARSDRLCIKSFVDFCPVLVMQRLCVVLAIEIVWECIALRANFFQLRAPFFDDLIGILNGFLWF